MGSSSSSSSSSIRPSQHSSTLFYWHESEFDDRDFQIHGRNLYFAIVLFCTVGAAAALFLCLRRICHLRFPDLHSPPRPPPPPPPGGSGGLDPTAIRGLPVMLCQRGPDPKVVESDCCICLAAFEDGDKVKVLPPCGHFYHCECVDRWLRAEPSCPLCRATLRVDSVVTIVTQ